MDAQWWIRGGLSRCFLSLLRVSSVFLCLSLSLCAVCLVTPSRPTLCNPINCSPSGSSIHGDSPGKNTGVGCPALLQGILSTQRSNQSLPHCRQILYCLSQQGSPRIQKWVAYPFSRGSSWPRNWTWFSCIADSLPAEHLSLSLHISISIYLYTLISIHVVKTFYHKKFKKLQRPNRRYHLSVSGGIRGSGL